MTIEELNKTKIPIVAIDKRLNKYANKTLFPDKLNQANKTLKTVGLPTERKTEKHYDFDSVAESAEKYTFQRYEEAKRHFEKALEINPQFAHAHFDLALLLYYILNEKEEAKKHYLLALSIDDSKVDLELESKLGIKR